MLLTLKIAFNDGKRVVSWYISAESEEAAMDYFFKHSKATKESVESVEILKRK